MDWKWTITSLGLCALPDLLLAAVNFQVVIAVLITIKQKINVLNLSLEEDITTIFGAENGHSSMLSFRGLYLNIGSVY
jgi:hypothetical protein